MTPVLGNYKQEWRSMMEESILTTTKKLLGITEEYEHFDQDIMVAINTALMTLNQIGVGKPEGFMVTDRFDRWNDFVPEEQRMNLGFIQSYVHLKTRLIFDPPQNSFTIESMNKMMSEIEWRLNVAVDYKSFDQ